MHIAIVHNALTGDSTPDEADVQVQAAAVEAALRRRGHRTEVLACDLDLERMRRQLIGVAPDMVFNLVESLAGTGRLIHLLPTLLEAMGVPYSGASAEALLFTSNKILAKQRMAAAGVPTPPWIGPDDARRPDRAGRTDARSHRWIVKSVWEHASVGIDAGSLLTGLDEEALWTALAQRAPLLGGTCFAERFIDGREFNLSLLQGPGGPRLLPAAEIRFEGFAADQPRIVDYRAKWDPTAPQYHHTPRGFDFSDADRPLLNRLAALALQCWDLFDLRGYARVDFRVDDQGRPWVLEVNANACLAPDAGFAAALAQAGIAFDEAIDGIVRC